MADEPRRSGRATKGINLKDRDINEDAPPSDKKKGKGKSGKSKAATEEPEEDEDEIIRCVCGLYEEEEDTPRAMICCDSCSAWQHNDCMGLPEEYEVDKYFCEQCRPQDHKELLAAIERGEKPWEEVAEQREQRKAAQSAKKKGGKKGKKAAASRPSEVPSLASQDIDGSPAASAGQKRKHEESPSAVDLKNVKKVRGTPVAESNGARAGAGRKSQSATPSRQASRSDPGLLVANVGDLQSLQGTRRGAAENLIKIFVDQTKAAVKSGAYSTPSGSNAQEVAGQLGLSLEHALYHTHAGGSGDPNDAYKNQLRTVIFNVKKNQALAVRLLSGDLAPHALANMNAKDMASEEQQKKDAAMIRKMEKQHIIDTESGPRIRRTHKGDEFVDESKQVAAESLTSNAPLRKASVADQDGDKTMTDVKSPTQATNKPGRPSARARPTADPQRKSSSNFDIDKVWSNVQGSPDGDGQRFGELPLQASGTTIREPAGPGAGADADIDELLKDEEVESPPYSPKDFAESDGTIWRGLVSGGSLGRFHASAKYAAGATPDSATLRMTYNQLVPAEIGIGGRIQPSKADEYLCGLEYSNTSDLVVVYLPEPTSSHDAEQFDKMFKYFKSKERFGVGMQHENPAIKDIYLIPLEVGQELPTFVKKLETDFPDPVYERMMLMPIVVKNSELPHNINNGPDGGAALMSPTAGGVVQTPITPYDGAFDMPAQAAIPYNPQQLPQQHSIPNGTPQPQPQPTPSYASPPPPINNTTTFSPNSHPQPLQQPTNISPATASAMKILGPQMATSPAVQQLIQQAPQAGDHEMEVVKECISENAAAALDLGVLTGMLQRRSTGGGGSGGSG